LPSGGGRAQAVLVAFEKAAVREPRQRRPVDDGEHVRSGQCPKPRPADALAEPQAREQQFLAAFFRSQPLALAGAVADLFDRREPSGGIVNLVGGDGRAVRRCHAPVRAGTDADVTTAPPIDSAPGLA